MHILQHVESHPSSQKSLDECFGEFGGVLEAARWDTRGEFIGEGGEGEDGEDEEVEEVCGDGSGAIRQSHYHGGYLKEKLIGLIFLYVVPTDILSGESYNISTALLSDFCIF
jgi:hypothetical protein